MEQQQQRSAAGGLRVGIVAPPWVPVPPPAYGGTELVIDVLARGLAARGHEVVLFTTGDSTCDVKRVWEYPVAFGNGIGTTAIELNHTAAAYAALAGCDLVHDHTLAGLWVSLGDPALPVVTTNHGPVVGASELADVYRRCAHRVPVIAISHDQAGAAGVAGISVAGVVHHGLDLGAYRYSPRGGDYVAVLGRMHPDKGIDRAITVARRAGLEVKIAAKMREPAEHAYYTDAIKPLIGPGVEYLGEVDHDAKVELLAGAKALLNPVRWPEPFGLVNVEALACGTPVVATNWGAIPELVTPDETGYVATTDAGLVEALGAIDRIDRAMCRGHAEAGFSMQRMAAEHESVYRTVIANWPTTSGRR